MVGCAERQDQIFKLGMGFTLHNVRDSHKRYVENHIGGGGRGAFYAGISPDYVLITTGY